ncbi:protein of unknown function [Yoonia rosea]|uniref:YjiS-like domain-containing protein n=1 Tax=Yoonia rosea TaxID=287098 RepID=A0A1R3WBK4_9RHOB|nr:DUF1127 domain-containing protein [Yoonia rosea]SIT75155.1 protein of unknown function [Yoonia rosea]
MTVRTETFFAGTSLGERIASFRAELAVKAAKRRVYNQTLSELQSLSSRDLNDLGMSRSMIKSVAYEAAYGK